MTWSMSWLAGTGMRAIPGWLATARVIAWRIHQVA
jgi:hypothetical protein